MKVVDIGEKNEFKVSLDIIKRNLPEMLEHIAITAKLRKANYDAHVKQGFTRKEALELCKNLFNV